MMKVALMEDIGKIGFTTRPIPKPKAGEVLVKLEYVGICGSDLHYYEHGQIGPFVVKCPFVLGHEPGGVVVEIGEGVSGLKVGDRVCLEPGISCHNCEFCRKGKYNLCPDVIFFATPPYDGVFQEYVAHPEELAFKLPDNVSTLEGALIEPLSVGFHAANQGSAAPGQNCFVFGSGCIGLVTMLALNAFGVSSVYVADVIDIRLEKAKSLGATDVINVSKSSLVDFMKEKTQGRGFDLIIETSGANVLGSAVEIAKKGSTIVLVGYPASGNANLPVGWILDKEITIKTVFRYRHEYPMAIEAVSNGKVNLKGIISNTFDFDDLQNAMDSSIHDKVNIVKSVVKI